MRIDLRKCVLVSCIFLMMCPKRSLTERRNKIRPPQVKLKHEQPNYGNLEVTEPGFDLTEEEIKKHKLWPDGIVPYFIDDYSYDKVLRDRIRAFLDNVNGMVGLHFVELPRPPEDDSIRWIFFINRRGLLDCGEVNYKEFTLEGPQRVTLGYDCIAVGDLAEVVLAIAGVPPQHNAPNRDNFITVQRENVLDDAKKFFDVLDDREWLFHDVAYDFASAGHFNFHEFTNNGQATIVPKMLVEIPVGEPTGFSHTDVWKIRMLYNYILKKHKPKAKVPACAKLFHPGTNFSKFTPDSVEDIKPRPKPNKYLGLPPDTPVEPNENPQDANSQADNSNIKNEEGNEEVLPNAESIERDIEGGDKSDDDDNGDRSRPKKLKDKVRKKKDKDPLNFQSDYQTDKKKKK